MTYNQAESIIWVPDQHSIDAVAEATVVVLETPGADSLSTHQASYLLTTYRRLLGRDADARVCSRR